MKIKALTLVAVLAASTTVSMAEPGEGRRGPGKGDRDGQVQRGDRQGRGPGAERGGREEGRGARGGRPDPMFMALDTNRDGKLSQSEVDGAVAALRKLDKNKDGVIALEEMRPEGRGPRGEGGPEGRMRGPRGEGGPEGKGGRPGGREGKGRGDADGKGRGAAERPTRPSAE